MHHHKKLQEVAKFVSGLVAADLISVIWLGAAGHFPFQIFSITFPESSILPIILFDAAVLIILIHFGWSVRLPLQSPKEKTLLYIVGLLLGAVSLMHLTRIAFGWDLTIGSFIAPEWLSWLGALITAYLSYAALHFAMK